MLKVHIIRLRYWHLMAFFMWLAFKFQLSAAPTGLVILALKDLGKGKIHHRQATKGQRHSRCTYNSPLGLTLALDVDGWSTQHSGRCTGETDTVPEV